MQDRYWMFQRNGVFYLEDKLNGKQKSLKTRDAAAARRMLAGKNQATEIPQMNLAMAKVYLSCKSEEMLARTWEDVMKDMEQAYHGPTLARWRTQMKSASFQGLRNWSPDSLLPEDKWTGHLGFIHEVVWEKYLRGHAHPKSVEYYLCGPPLMIKVCTKMLAEMGIPVNQIACDEF